MEPSAHLDERAKHLRDWIIVGTICLIGLAVRTIGLTNDLPHYHHMDEWYVVDPAYEMGSLDFNPHEWDQPACLQIYLTFALYVVYAGYSFATGRIDSIQELKDEYRLIDHSNFYLLGRFVVIAFSIATIVLIFLHARQRWGRRVGWLSAGALALLPLHIMLSRWAMKDAPSAFFVILCLYCCDKLMLSGKRLHYIIAGATIGLAVSVKYHVGLLCVPVTVAHWVRWHDERCRNPLSLGWLTDRRLWIAVGASLGAFVATSPFAIIAFPEFWNGFMSQFAHHSAKGHPGYEPAGNPWIFYLSDRLGPSVTIPFLMVACIGMCLDWRQHKRRLLPAFSFFMVFWFFLGLSKVSFLRYALPHLPIIAMYGAFGVLAMIEGIRTTLTQHPVVIRIAATILVSASFAPVATETVRDVVGYAQADTREIALTWIREQELLQAVWIADGQGPKLDNAIIEIVTGKELSYKRIQFAIEKHRPTHMLVSGYTLKEMLNPVMQQSHPELSQAYPKLIEWLHENGELKLNIKGEDGYGRGPQIWIYKLKLSASTGTISDEPGSILAD